MKEMVDDFSEYAKPSKKQSVDIDMPALIQEVLALYALKSGITFNADHETGLLVLKGDPVSIRQVLHNLIKNALEATEEKGRIEINLRRVQKNNTDFIEIALYDDGPGIKEDQIEQIFEPYVTTKAKGTGLGLAIVKKIIEEHGGAIWVDSRRTVGAGFILQLPASHL
jgi:nitrogen fixation/metabolism regulation signal transduction histidine kinase